MVGARVAGARVVGARVVGWRVVDWRVWRLLVEHSEPATRSKGWCGARLPRPPAELGATIICVGLRRKVGCGVETGVLCGEWRGGVYLVAGNG